MRIPLYSDHGINWSWKLWVAAKKGYLCGKKGKEKGGALEIQEYPWLLDHRKELIKLFWLLSLVQSTCR